MAAVLALRVCTHAAEQQPLVTAKKVDIKSDIWTLNGEVTFRDEEVLLIADDVTYNTKTHDVVAVGHIIFTGSSPRSSNDSRRRFSNARLLADRLTYNRVTGKFAADGIRLGSHPYFVEGFSAEGTREEITVHRARVSYGEPGPWQPTVVADKIVVVPGKRIRTENAAGGIGHLQPLPFPKFQHEFSQPFAATVAFTGGFRRSLGVFADSTIHVPVSPALRVGADLGIFTNRGVMFGPSGRYQQTGEDPLLRGYFRSGFINDHGDKKTDILNRPVPEERAFFEWQHEQVLAPNLTLAAQVNWWKDSEVVRDFRPRAFFPVQQPDTYLESVYTGGNYFVSAFARFQPNRFHRVQERLPEVRFDLLPLALGNGFYHRFSASAAVLREDPVIGASVPTLASITNGVPPGFGVVPSPILPFPPGGVASSASSFANSGANLTRSGSQGDIWTQTDPYYSPATTLRSNRLDGYYALTRPFAPRDWLAITPMAGGRITHYANTRGVNREGSYTRVLGEIGADAVLRGSGTFDYKNPQWKIDGLRHLVSPRLSYRYIPEHEDGRQPNIPFIDRRAFSTYLQPLGLGDVRNIDDLHATNTLRLSIDNVLQTRDPVDGARDLLAFNVANDFRFKRRPGERDVSEIHTELALYPARWLQFDLYQSFAPQSFTLRELNSGVTIRDGNAWSMRFGNNFLRTQIQDYSIDGRFRINERFEALTRLHYDARRRRFNEQAYGIAQNLGNTWLVSYTVRLYSGRRRESSFGFNVEIEAVRF